MKKALLSLVLTLVLSSQVFGYATVYKSIFTPNGDKIMIGSNVEKASIYVDGRKVGRTSDGQFTYFMKRDGVEHTIRLSKDGYRDAEVTVTPQLGTLYWLNILGISGSTFMSSTDSWTTKNGYSYSPGQIYLELERN